jgi:hypothetical protein
MPLRITARRIFLGGGPVLAPVYRRDVEELRALSGEDLRTAVVRYTSTDKIRRWYWALVQTVADGLGVHKNYLHVKIKEEMGFLDDIVPGKHGPIPIFRTTREGEISPAELRSYVRAAVEIIHIKFLPGVPREHVYRRVEELEGIKRPQF